MKNSNSQISIILAFISAAVVFTILLIVVGGINVAAITAIISYVIFYIVFRVVLYSFIYRSLEGIWENLKVLRKGKSPFNPYNNVFTTEVIEDELQLLLREKALEIDHLKEIEFFRKEFLGNVAHELRTPIFSIQGYLHTLLDGAADDIKVRDKFLKTAARNADSLTSMLEDLMTISSVESNQVKIEWEVFCLNELITEVIENTEFLALERKIKIQLKASKSIKVKADRQKVRQVFVNLVSNSIKYGVEGGHTNINLFEMGDSVLIEVADNGLGIDKKDLPRIFERFYKVDKNRSRVQGGSTGLGLAIVKHFIEAHHQKITVRSSLGKGTVFSFTLPSLKYEPKTVKSNKT